MQQEKLATCTYNAKHHMLPDHVIPSITNHATHRQQEKLATCTYDGNHHMLLSVHVNSDNNRINAIQSQMQHLDPATHTHVQSTQRDR